MTRTISIRAAQPRRKLNLLKTGAAVLAVMGMTAAHGQQSQNQSLEDRLRSQLRGTTEQLQALQSQQAQVNAAKAAAEAQRDAAQQELAQLRAQLDAVRDSADKLAQGQNALREAARSQIAASNAQATRLKEAYDELLALARAKEAERARTQASLTERESLLALCQRKNDALYSTGTEILHAYENFSTGDLLKIRQPLSRQARIDFDNQAQAYGDKLYDSRFDPRQATQKPADAAQAVPVPEPAPAGQTAQ